MIATSRRRGVISLIAAVTLVGALVPVFVNPRHVAAASDPDNTVKLTLEGCSGTTASYLPNSFVCPDAGYGTGNLGKGWNELDLVPFRIVATAGNAQTYSIIAAADYIGNNGSPGYDFISVPQINAGESTAGCAVSAGAMAQTANNAQNYRLLTITAPAGSNCVIDYYERLAVGAHNYPGSSLHSNLLNQSFGTQGIGAQDRSINPNEIVPQSASKDMTAVRGSDHSWTVGKSAEKASLPFTNTCAAGATTSQQVTITITWTEQPAVASGPATITTHVYATNPAHRTITATATDSVYRGTTATGTPIDTQTGAAVDVPANTTNMLVMTLVTTDSSPVQSYNDVATLGYTDTVTGVPVPGTTQATASANVQLSGPVLDTSATITDSTSIVTGGAFTYSIDSVSTGTLTTGGNPYTLGTATTSQVDWSSGSQSGSGSATLTETVYDNAPANATGTLNDQATLTGSSGFTAQTPVVTVNLSSTATATLTVNKTIPAGDTVPQAFNFTATGGIYGSTPNPFSVSVTSGTTGSSTLTGLTNGTYTLTESQQGNYGPQPPADVPVAITTGVISSCSPSTTFQNGHQAAAAEVEKITNPVGSEAGWDFVLTGPGAGDTSATQPVHVSTPAGGGPIAFNFALEPGTYTITENPGAFASSWDLTNVQSIAGGATTTATSCSFTVAYPANAGALFGCSFTNTARGHIIVKKQTLPGGSTQQFTFTPSYNGGATFQLADGGQNDSGALVPGGYSVAEGTTTGWDSTAASCDNGNDPSAITLAAGATVTCTFTNTQRGQIVVQKMTVPSGSTQQFSFTPSWGSGFQLGDGGSTSSGSLKPGSGYSVSEQATAGWDLTSAMCDNGNNPSSITLTPGQTVTCTFVNTQRGHIIVKKQTLPGGSAQQFTFTPSYNGGTTFQLTDGGQNDSGALVPGGYSVSEGTTAGWDSTSATCDNGNSPSSISLGPGQTVTCTFVNTQRGQIVVKKQTVPTGSTQLFTFTPSYNGGSTFQLSDGHSSSSGFLVPGGYSVSEQATAGWDLTSATCDNGNSPSSIALSAGQTVTCTFVNTQRGHIIVQKTTLPSGSTQQFTFTPSYNGGATFQLADGGQSDSGALVPGGYSVSEGATAGWDNRSATCDNGNSPSSITLAAGQTVTCTFTNTQRAHIIVKKQTVPAGSTQQFTFTPSYNGGATFHLADGGQNDSGAIVPGSGYSVSEGATAGWDTTSATCDNGNSPSSITLNPGQTVTCTFVNTQRGHIIVKKTTLPAGSTQQFTFTPSYNGGATFQLTDGGQNDSGALVPGGYSVSEGATAGWDNTSATCSSGNSPSSITLNAGQTVTCTFTNTQRGHIIVKKQTAPSGSTQQFTFTPSYNGGATFQLTDGGQNDSGALTPGSYSVSEAATTGWDTTSATCSNGNSPSSIALNAGQTVTCTFVNTQRGTIVVKKKTVPSGSTQQFSFTPSYAGGFQLTDGGSNTSGLLKPGSYSVSEGATAGWVNTGASCDNGNSPSSISLTAGATVTCTFTNTQLNDLKIVKTFMGGTLTGTQTYTFTLTGGPAGHTVSLTQVASSTNGGVIYFGLSGTTPTLYAGTYTLCEIIPGPAWSTSIQQLPGAYEDVTTDPNNPRECAPITIPGSQPPQTVTNVNNMPPPGGAPLTIGFWKTHGCTSNGNQKDLNTPLLPLRLSNASGSTYPGVTVTSCNTTTLPYHPSSFDVLSHSSMTYAEHGLAAQLLGALFDVAAGARTCTAETNAISTAIGLLTQIKWTGADNTTVVSSKNALYSQFNATQTILNSYNNGQLC